MFDIQDIIKKLKRLFTGKDLFFIFLLAALFFGTRLINISRFPVFTDEGIYIHWAKIAWHDASWRFISLTDGRQPLQTWGTIPFLKLLPENALLAGRLFAVSTGFASLIGIFILLYNLFGKKAAIIGSFLYVLTPFFLFYDRLALADSGVNTAFIWILLLSIILIRTVRLDVALILGFVAGLSLLLKSSVRIFIAMMLVSPVLILEKNLSRFGKKLINYLFLFGLVGTIALVVYNVQRLSPFFHFVAEKNNTFVMTFQEFMKSPFSVFSHNLIVMPYYILSELGWVIGIVGLVGILVMFKKDKKTSIFFMVWFLVPFMAIALFSRVIFPRYLIFLATILFLLSVYCLIQLNKKYAFVLICMISLSFFVYDIIILTRPRLLPFPEIDRGQYIEGVTAGWHLDTIMDFARKKGNEKPVVVLGEGNFGLVSDMLDVFLKPKDNVSIKGYWPLDEKVLKENQPLLSKYYVYVVFSHRDTFPPTWPIKLVQKFTKPGNKSAFYLFELVDDKRQYYGKSQ